MAVLACIRRPQRLYTTLPFVNTTSRRFGVQSEKTSEETVEILDYSRKKPVNRVYVWGFASYGALGKPQFVKPKKGQKPLYALHKPGRLVVKELNVKSLACGYGFTVMAVDSEKHKVWGTGLNSDSQLGYHDVRKGHPLEFLIALAPIGVPFQNPRDTKVTEVSCGRAHTLVKTNNEGTFCFGNNSYGQCGRPVVEGEVYSGNSTVHKVHNLEGENIKNIVCGQDHTLFLTDNGGVYSCGWGADGQTGLGHYRNEWKPSKVTGDVVGEKIIHLSSAGDCVLAVSEKGDVFGWGNSEYKQLSLGTDEQQLCVSRHLSLPNVGKVVRVAASGTMCAVLNEKGSVYVWGYGILGLGPSVQNAQKPTLIPSTLFGQNEMSPDLKVEHIACGLNYFAAITNQKTLYMWGKNTKSCLGLGHRKDQFFPFQVSVPAEVLNISCGVDHCAAICKPFV